MDQLRSLRGRKRKEKASPRPRQTLPGVFLCTFHLSAAAWQCVAYPFFIYNNSTSRGSGSGRETTAAAAVATTMPAYQADNHTHTHKCMCMCMCIAHRPTFARCACKKEKNRHKWQLVRTTFLRRSFFGPFFALAARTTTHSLTGQ